MDFLVCTECNCHTKVVVSVEVRHGFCIITMLYFKNEHLQIHNTHVFPLPCIYRRAGVVWEMSFFHLHSLCITSNKAVIFFGVMLAAVWCCLVRVWFLRLEMDSLAFSGAFSRKRTSARAGGEPALDTT